jgi:hypothetical protein
MTVARVRKAVGYRIVEASQRLDDHPYLDRRRPGAAHDHVIAVNHVPGDLAHLVAIGRFAQQ